MTNPESVNNKEQIRKIANSVFTASINSYSMPVAVFLLGFICWGLNQWYQENKQTTKDQRDTQIAMQLSLTEIKTTLNGVKDRLTRVETNFDKKVH